MADYNALRDPAEVANNFLAIRRQQQQDAQAQQQRNFVNSMASRDQSLQEDQFAYNRQQSEAQNKLSADQRASQVSDQEKQYLVAGIQHLAQAANDPAQFAALADHYAADPIVKRHGVTRDQITPQSVMTLAQQMQMDAGQAPSQQEKPPEVRTINGVRVLMQGGKIISSQMPQQVGPESFSPVTQADGSIALVGSRGTIRGTNLKGETKGSASGQAQKAAAQKASMATTLELYKTARDGLLSGLEGTSTGPVMGRIPAVTSAQQIGEGGVAAMAPVLKQIFRVAGEGTFTDKDQALLLQMVPTRVDNPKAIASKIANIDKIVQAKLGGGVQSGAPAPVPGMIQDGYQFKGGDPGDQNNWEPVQ